MFLSYRNRKACKSFLPWGIKYSQQWYLLIYWLWLEVKVGGKCEFDLDFTSQEIAERLCEGHIIHKTALKSCSTCNVPTQSSCWPFSVIQRSKNKPTIKEWTTQNGHLGKTNKQNSQPKNTLFYFTSLSSLSLISRKDAGLRILRARCCQLYSPLLTVSQLEPGLREERK